MHVNMLNRRNTRNLLPAFLRKEIRKSNYPLYIETTKEANSPLGFGTMEGLHMYPVGKCDMDP